MDSKERTKREKKAYDEGNVYEESYKLHNKFLHVFQCVNTKEGENYLQSTINKYSKNNYVLDVGCYTGISSKKILSAGAKSVLGIDISEKGINEANSTSLHANLKFKVMDANNLNFNPQTFDCIVGRGILHHLEYNKVILDIHKILKPNGVAIFIEPLGDNSFAKIIRFLTPKARTKDEAPLSKNDIEYANKVFKNNSHKYINLLSVPFGMLTSLIKLKPNNYFLLLSHALDTKLSKTFLKYYLRQVVLVWKK